MNPLTPEIYEALLEEDKRKRLPIENEDISYLDSLLTTDPTLHKKINEDISYVDSLLTTGVDN